MLIELLLYNPVLFVNRPLQWCDKAAADRATNFVPKFTKKQSGRDVNDECTMVTGAVQEWQHAYIQYLYFWWFVASIDGYGSVDVYMVDALPNICVWILPGLVQFVKSPC